MNSTESVNEEQQKPNRMEVDAAAKRFIHWIQKDQSISEKQRKKTMEAVSFSSYKFFITLHTYIN
jgi:hypothetical protein